MEDINLVRDEDTGGSKGFGFLRYEDANSCIMAVDNMNGTEILGRVIRVDHKDRYTAPKAKREEREAMLGKYLNICLYASYYYSDDICTTSY